MKCPIENQGEELLLNYVSGALDAQAAALFERHVSTCAACAKFAREQKAVWGALDEFEAAPVSPDFDRRLYQRMDRVSWRGRIVAAIQASLPTRRGFAVAAAAAALVVAGVIWQRPAATPNTAQAPLSAKVESVQPDQVQHALDDMEMLREFNHAMRSGSPESKM